MLRDSSRSGVHGRGEGVQCEASHLEDAVFSKDASISWTTAVVSARDQRQYQSDRYLDQSADPSFAPNVSNLFVVLGSRCTGRRHRLLSAGGGARKKKSEMRSRCVAVTGLADDRGAPCGATPAYQLHPPGRLRDAGCHFNHRYPLPSSKSHHQ